jgi:aerobic carbon-monoxide dehydrogenase medium subunit
VLAGGQSLMPLLNMRLARPRVVVDINRVPDLAYVPQDARGLAIGATTRQSALEASPVAQAACPLLVEALHHVAHPPSATAGRLAAAWLTLTRPRNCSRSPWPWR